MNEVIPMPTSQELVVRQDFAAKLQGVLKRKQLLLAGGSMIGLAVALPVAIMAMQTALALAVSGGIAIGGGIAWKMIPRWMLTIENRERERTQVEMNRHLAALKAEAKRNPIEQAQTEYLRRSKQYDTFKAAMETIGGNLRSISSSLAKKKREKPNYDLSQETEALQKMQEFYDNRMERLRKAFTMLGQFKEKIEEAQTKWEFQLAANAAIRAMNATDKDARIGEILTEVAFDSVQREFDTVFARLDVDAAEISATPALAFGGGLSIDVSSLNIAQPELVSAGRTAGGR